MRRFWEAQTRGDLDAVKEIMAPDFVTHNLLASHNLPYLRRRSGECEELRAFSSTATGWLRLITPRVRCSASLGSGHSSLSMVRRVRWRRHSWNRYAALAQFPSRAVPPIVLKPLCRSLPLGQSKVLSEAPKLSIATVDPTTPIGPALALVVVDHGGEMGITSEPQAGHQ